MAQQSRKSNMSTLDKIGSILVVVLAGALMLVKAVVVKESSMVAEDAAPLIYLAIFFYMTRGRAKSTLAWAVQAILIIVAGGILFARPNDAYCSSPLVLALLAARFHVG